MERTDSWIILFQTGVSASKEIRQVTQMSYYAGDVVWGLTFLRHKEIWEGPL